MRREAKNLMHRTLFTSLIFACALPAYAEEEPPQVLTVVDAINRGLDANKGILGSYEAYERAQINLELNESFFEVQITPSTTAGIAGGGEFGTGLALGGGVAVSKKFEQGSSISVEPTIYKRGNNYETNVRTIVTQPLLRGFGFDYNLSGIAAAQYLLRSSHRSVYVAQISLILKIVNQMYTVARNREGLALYQASYDRLKGYYDAARVKERIGLVDAEDLYRAQTAFKQAEDALHTAREQLEESQDLLKDTLSLPITAQLTIDVPIHYDNVGIDPNTAIDTALQNRIEIDQANDTFHESLRLAKLGKERLWPEVNLVMTYNNTGVGRYLVDTYRYKRDNTWNIGFTTSTDINKDSDCLAYEQALLSVGNAQRTIDQVQYNIALEVKRTLRQIDRAYKRIQLQEQQIKTALCELKLAQLKFNRGFADNFNVIQAERNLITARTTLLGAVVDHILGQYQLLAVLGLLADKPNNCR